MPSQAPSSRASSSSRSPVHQFITAIQRAWMHLLFKRTILVLSLFLVAGMGAALWNTYHLSSSLIRTQALQSSRLYARAIQEARSLYSDEVVSKVDQDHTMTVGLDYTHLVSAIPVPASFLIDLGDRISEKSPGMSVRLFSDYPFPTRQDGGPHDAFEREALIQLRQNPDRPFFRIESFQGQPSFRFAQADRMAQSCVDCHNQLSESPRTDWQVGDVRGVLEITTPLSDFVKRTRMGLEGTVMTLGGLFGLGGVGLALVIGRLKRISQELELRVVERTAELSQMNQQLVEEQEKSERLLLNILPEPIAHRLKDGQSSIADGFSDVTILFADIVNFTRLSTEVSPEMLVSILNDVFSTFDQLTEQFGLEKIKTIGDAYMVAGGLPTPRDDHAKAIAEMALAMRQSVYEVSHRLNQPIDLRIGINTGPVVAGVIGQKKFIYDLWGDTVNLASRMESQGVSGAIQVTPQSYKRLCDRYTFEPRGLVDIKGKGKMTTYWLTGRCLD